MLTSLIRFTIVACLVLSSRSATAQDSHSTVASSPGTPQWNFNDPATEHKIDALLHKMTLEEKVGQLVQYSAGQPTGPGTGRTEYTDMIQKGEIGALFNITTAKDANAFQHVTMEKSRLKIPLVYGLDVIHGYRTEFPIPLGLAASWDPELVQRTARVAAHEASASGIRWMFSPMIDIARDARWGRMAEGSGEDPFLVSAMARAYVLGYQGERVSAADSAVACPKHYVGYGAAEGGRDYNSVEISEHTLREFYLPPFLAAVDAGAATIMTAFDSLNGVPASANPFTIKQILRKEWGFQGLVDSDWTSIAELISHGIANDPATAARKAFLAGVEMDMVSSFYHDHLANLVRSSQVPEAAVDEAVRHVLRVKFALGLFEHPYADEKQEAGAMLQPESVALARAAAERSFVLLKNSPSAAGSPLLPLSSDSKNVALIGPLADDAAVMLGSWSAQGRPEDVVTLRAALIQKLGADHVRYAKGSDITKASDEQLAEAVKAAQDSDTVILALGENASEMTGEAASRAHLGLPGRQQPLLEAIAATGKPVVLVLFSGRPLTLPWAFEHVPAVLAAWFPGVQAGPALVRTLFGESNPSGKLPVTWPRSVGQEPLYYNALNTGRPAGNADLTKPSSGAADKYISRYIDEQNSPQFPFGYGLTYTNFNYGPTQTNTAQLSAKTLNIDLQDPKHSSNSDLTVSTDITNTGTRAGEETVQLYVRLEGTSTAQPIRALKGFQHVKLAAGETQHVSFHLGPEAFALWDDQNKYVAEPARVKIWISPDSAHGSEATLDITK
ncbi:MAG TPA: beta-glucosidase BglX [Candidatus Acidoferrum sp.]|nr:beta-glucosidase BglX [Candidatus Acidoferrum sp.]